MSTQAEQYKKATEEFLSLVNSLNSSDLDKSDAEGWTPRQVIHHMADSESQSFARLRRLIAEPGTIIQGYEEGLWAENPTLGYKDQPIESAVAIFKAVRQGSYELISRLSNEQLSNAGTHSESGHYTVEKWLQSYTNHPVDHANQIRKQIS
jgi:hypothetical protein